MVDVVIDLDPGRGLGQQDAGAAAERLDVPGVRREQGEQFAPEAAFPT